MYRKNWITRAALLVMLVPLCGCLFHRRTPTVLMSTAKLKSAGFAQLVDIVNGLSSRIQTLNATVDITAATGGSAKGKITEYQQIKGYILVRKPNMLRMIGLFPIVRNRAFDMVSDGDEFKLWLPSQNRFIVGRNDVIIPNAKQPLENLRPQFIYEALLIPPVVFNSNEVAVLEQANQRLVDAKTHKEILQPEYRIDVIQRQDGQWILSRKIYIERTYLQPYRQVIYDKNGNVATDATYYDFKEYNGVLFPSAIHIFRPQEEYSVTLDIVKLTANAPLKDEQFALAQPAGAQVVHLAAPTQSSAAAKPTR
jgi:outer membrane lipoprotein-sorting protein